MHETDLLLQSFCSALIEIEVHIRVISYRPGPDLPY